MIEIEKVKKAKLYIEKLANGLDPITDEPAALSDVVNQIQVSRCLFYVTEILRQVIVKK